MEKAIGTEALARLLSALAALIGSYGIAYLSALLFLVVRGAQDAIERFAGYCWLIGAFAAVLSLFLAGLRKPRITPWLLAGSAVVPIVLYLMRLLEQHGPIGTIFRYTVFFTHIAASALFGILISIAIYRQVEKIYE